jgi:hypothetical protein
MVGDYVVCWEDTYGDPHWEVISGEDAMNIRVHQLCESGIVEEEDIVVGEITEDTK